MSIHLADRYAGCLLGLAAGDAVGTTVEFRPRGSFAPVTDMTGGGPFNLELGQWTDDTSMALCLAVSLIEQQGFNANDQMQRYLNWWQNGYLSCTGECFDIGMTVATALRQYQQSGQAFAGSTNPRSAGNGSLMRLAPIVLYFLPSHAAVWHFSAESSRTTHAAPEAIEACQLLAEVIRRCLLGWSKTQVLATADLNFSQAKVQALARGDYQTKSAAEIRGSGYAIDSLEAVLWCFYHQTSFATAILAAVNLGDDADTTAAITGQIAGAFYGLDAIPAHWRQRLAMRDYIVSLSHRLLELSATGAALPATKT